MKKLLLIFFSLSLVSYSIPAFAQSPKLDPQQENALKEIWKKLRLDGKKGWYLHKDPCSGEGKWVDYVKCDCSNSTCRVTDIVIIKENVSTILPTDFTKLPYLKTLSLRCNYLKGTIPPEWSTMRLSILSLSRNRLSGPFPIVLTRMTTLVKLNIEGNRFTGPIPKEIANLKNLEYINLASNDFTGELPVTLAKLTNLLSVKLSDNNFSGKIPNFISQWTKIQILQIQGCSFKGPIPSGISVLTELNDLRISDLKGGASTFPQLDNITQLHQLVLRNCFIYGSIPDYVGNIISLHILDLSFNNLTGEIPSSFSELRDVNYMYLSTNNLTGPIPEWILSSTKNVDVSYNQFTLDASKIKNCEQRTRNVVEGFSSSSTKEISNIHPCLRKDFPCTKPIAEQIYSLHINCGGGEVDINNTIKYEADDIERNGASIYYSAKDWAFSSTGNFLDDDHESDVYIISNTSCLDSMMSTSDAKLYTTARRAAISLTYYGLCLRNGNYNVSLHFAEIVYTQDNTFNSLGERVFDVYVQGELKLKDFNIAKEAGGAGRAVIKRFMTDVTNNTLKVQLYWAGKGTTSIPEIGNYGPIISAISVEPNFKPQVFGQKTRIPVGIIIAAAVIAGFIAACLIICCLLWLRRCYTNMGKPTSDREDIQENMVVYTADEIQIATENFNPSNKLGEGGFGIVYKGTLKDGRVCAIKILSSKSEQGVPEFTAEVSTISALRHPNIAKLYGLSIHEEQFALVYEYMENNSLRHALFGTNQELKLQFTWEVRLRICTEIAQGLDYIHTQSPVLIHRDIKCSNVLLDANLTAKISDFGLACTKKDGETHASTSAAGTPGYMVRETSMPDELSTARDVYSYGVVALEIFSGKRVIPKANDSYSDLVEYAYELLDAGHLLKLVDPSLGSNYASQEEALRVLQVALLCINKQPGLRPSMTEVVEALTDQASFEQLLGHQRYADDDPFSSKTRALRNKMLWSDKSKSRLDIDETYTMSTVAPSRVPLGEIKETEMVPQ